ncbi:hypothetical protein ACFSSA_06190 [Luteolibacter algae]|uniref:Uncharacterized protein n=1 Tax=Luteolibacter algae TaxID=454151 RepID=A0ABW5D9B2_9BACT
MAFLFLAMRMFCMSGVCMIVMGTMVLVELSGAIGTIEFVSLTRTKTKTNKN